MGATGQSFSETQGGSTIDGSKLGPGRHVGKGLGDDILRDADHSGHHLGGRGDQARLLKDFIEREKGGSQVHPLGAAQGQAAMVVLHSAGLLHLGSLALFPGGLSPLPP